MPDDPKPEDDLPTPPPPPPPQPADPSPEERAAYHAALAMWAIEIGAFGWDDYVTRAVSVVARVTSGT